MQEKSQIFVKNLRFLIYKRRLELFKLVIGYLRFKFIGRFAIGVRTLHFSLKGAAL